MAKVLFQDSRAATRTPPQQLIRHANGVPVDGTAPAHQVPSKGGTRDVLKMQVVQLCNVLQAKENGKLLLRVLRAAVLTPH